MDMEGEGEEGPREEEAMVGKEGSVLMGFYLGERQDTINIIKTSPSYSIPHSGA